MPPSPRLSSPTSISSLITTSSRLSSSAGVSCPVPSAAVNSSSCRSHSSDSPGRISVETFQIFPVFKICHETGTVLISQSISVRGSYNISELMDLFSSVSLTTSSWLILLTVSYCSGTISPLWTILSMPSLSSVAASTSSRP